MLIGIDISEHNGIIDFDRVKPQIDFAVLRVGYGDNIASQDDKRFNEYITNCERLNIPYGVYIYSYAQSEAQILSEVRHTLRLINGHNPFCVYIDMEDGTQVKFGRSTLTSWALRFCREIKAVGHKAGVYANENWFKNYLDVSAIYNEGYSVWCAKYSSYKPQIVSSYDVWQYTSDGAVDGIKSRVDMNYMYNDIRNKEEKKEEETEMRFNLLKDVSADYKPTVEKLLQKGYIHGKSGSGEDTVIDLNEDTLRAFVINDRAGLYDRYHFLKEVPAVYRPELDSIIKKGLFKGQGGSGEELVVDLTEDAVRVLITAFRG